MSFDKNAGNTCSPRLYEEFLLYGNWGTCGSRNSFYYHGSTHLRLFSCYAVFVQSPISQSAQNLFPFPKKTTLICSRGYFPVKYIFLEHLHSFQWEVHRISSLTIRRKVPVPARLRNSSQNGMPTISTMTNMFVVKRWHVSQCIALT